MSVILSSNYKKILEVDQNAKINDIKKAYRKKAKEYHPDLNKNPNANLQFIIINEAYTYLINEIKGNPQSKNRNTANTETHKDWESKERARARAKAAHHAKMKFEEFKETRIYKTSKIAALTTYYSYFALGFMVMIIPVVYTIINGLDPDDPGKSIAGLLAGVIVGGILMGGIFFSKYEFSNGKIKLKVDNELY